MTVTLLSGRWQDVLGTRECDAIVTDPPYSARTHAGHNSGAGGFADGSARASLGYRAWTADDVSEAARDWAARCAGWVCVMSDHVLAECWADELASHGRYTFSPIACVEPGSRVRRVGDGPAQWSTWLIVARPRKLPWSRWGALPGAYVVPKGQPAKPRGVAGAKPLWLMRAIVRDYSRADDLVMDPCAGGGTTLMAAAIEGRDAIGCEADTAVFNDAHARLARGWQTTLEAMK